LLLLRLILTCLYTLRLRLYLLKLMFSNRKSFNSFTSISYTITISVFSLCWMNFYFIEFSLDFKTKLIIIIFFFLLTITIIVNSLKRFSRALLSVISLYEINFISLKLKLAFIKTKTITWGLVFTLLLFVIC